MAIYQLFVVTYPCVLRRFKPVGVLRYPGGLFAPYNASEGVREAKEGCRCASRSRSMLGLAALRAAGSGLESGYSKGRVQFLFHFLN